MSIRSVGAWRSAFNLNNWLNSQGAITQQDASVNDAANSAFATAQSNYFQNLVQAELKAKQAALQKLVSSVGSNVNKVA
jgi:hypothetical protein